METNKYLYLAFRDPLSDQTTYRQLSSTAASARVKAIQRIVSNYIDTYHKTVPDDEDKVPQLTDDGKFLKRSLDVEDPFAKFYLLAKIHKTPLKTRPIISVSGSLLHGLGRWLDLQ